MFKRRNLWKLFALLAVGSATAAVVWALFFRKDQDFQWIGPETDEIRKLCGRLETPIDMLDFQEPRNLGDTLRAVCTQLEDQGSECPIITDQPTFFDDHEIENIGAIRIRFPPGLRRMSLRQFLKAIIEQVPTKNGVFLLWHHGHLELTTAEQARREKEWYREEYRITPFDRLRQRLSEITGGKGNLPIPPLKPGGRAKRLDGPA